MANNYGLISKKIWPNRYQHAIDTGKRLNSIESNHWILIDEINLKEVNILWDNTGIHPSRVSAAKEFIRASFGKGETSHGVLYGRSKTIKNKVANYKLFANATNQLFGSQKRLEKLTLTDLRDILCSIVTKPDGSLWSVGTAENVALIIRKCAEFYSTGLMTDGISIEFPNNNLIGSFLKEYIESKGIKFHEWSERGSWGNLTIDAALFFLSKQIEIIESPATDFFIDYFDFQRSDNKVHPDELYKEGEFSRKLIKAVKDIKCCTQSSDQNKFGNLYEIAKIFNKHGFLDTNNNVNKAKFKPVMFKIYPGTIKKAALAITTAMSGIRISEIASIRPHSFKINNGTIFFISSIYKNDLGLPRKRSISKHAFSAIQKAYKVSYFPLNADVSPFSSTAAYRCNFNKVNPGKSCHPQKTVLAIALTTAYEKCIISHGDQTKDYPKSTSPHALRHIFSAIALRSFKGDVKNHIQRHFGHSACSHFTKYYVDNKLNDAIVTATEADFFKGYIDSVAPDDTEFFKAVTKRIREHVASNHIFTTPTEFGDYFIKESLNACKVVGHEFGYSICIYDIEDEDEDLDIHHLTDKSKPEDIVRTGITHNHLIESIENEEIRKVSAKILEVCETMLSELNVNMEELCYE